MMDMVSDNSNRNGGAAMGVGGAKKISYNLIIRLLLVSGTLYLFSPFLLNVCGVSVCSFTGLDLVDCGVNVFYFTG